MKSLLIFISAPLLVYILIENSHARELEAASDKPCPTGQHWVRQHSRRAYVRGDGTAVSASLVKAHCSTNPPGYEHWKSLIRNDRPKNWPNATEKSKKWSQDETEIILEALGTLPKELQSVTIFGLHRMDKSHFYPNPASTDRNGNIVIYDNAFTKNANTQRIIAHEIAHTMYWRDPELDKSYREAAGWYNISPNFNHPEYVPLRKDFIEADGANSPEEDFSNNLENYFYNPKKLEAISPGVFLWLKNRYGGGK